MNEENFKSVLIVAKPGRMRSSLRALLKAVPQFNIVDQVDDGLAVFGTPTTHHPALVVLGSSPTTDQIRPALKTIKNRWPQTKCIYLADNIEQQRLAKIAGADSALLKGFSAATLFATIDNLLRCDKSSLKQRETIHES